MMENRKGLLKPTIQITVLSFAGIALSFISQLIIAYLFGVTAERDAYFAAVVVPTYITAIITGSIGILFIPQIIEIAKLQNQKKNVFINTVLVFTTLLLLVIIILGFLFSRTILQYTAPGFEIETIIYTEKLYRVLLFSTIFSVLTNLISSLYQIKHQFIRPAIAPIINIPIIIGAVFFLNAKIGIMSLAIGTLLGSIISFLFVVPILFKDDFKFNLKIDIYDKYFVLMLNVSLPLFLGGILFRSAPLIERMIASNLATGSISILGYSGQLITVMSTIATSGIVTSFFPTMSNAWTSDYNLFNHFFNKGIRSILILTVPIAISFILFGNVFIEILFQRGVFSSNDTIALSKTFALMTPAFVMLCLGGITSRVYYISKRTLDLTIIATLEIISYLLITYFLSLHYGYLGIAFGTSITYTIYMLVYFLYATKIIIKNYDYKSIIIDILKILVISILSFTLGYFLFIFVNNLVHEYLAVVASLLTSSTIYILLLYKFKNLEVTTLINKIRKNENKTK